MAENENLNTENQTTGMSSAASTKAKEENSTSNASGSASTSSSSSSTGGDMASQVGGVLRGDTGAVKNLYDKAKESGGELAGEMLSQAKDKASSTIDEQKSNLATGLGSIADGIRQMGDNLRNSDESNNVVELTAKYGESLAGQVENLSNYLDRKEVREMVRDVESFARRNPLIFIGGAFAIGLLAARFLKTSSANQALAVRSESSGGQNYRSENDRDSSKASEAKSGESDTTAQTSTIDTETPAY